MAWTKQQADAIEKDNTNIIVSAGAGSGKTAVLTQRVLRKVEDSIDVDKLLILTFTNAAAKEMKDRIKSNLIKNNYLEQVELLNKAYITTFDSFAYSVLKTNAYKLGLSKKIKIESGNLLKIKKIELLDQIFEEKYLDDKFVKFIGEFCTKDDKDLKNQIIELSNKLDLKYDKKEYLDSYIKEYFSSDYLDSKVSDYTKLLLRIIDKIKEDKKI